jgi:hypothetical protein
MEILILSVLALLILLAAWDLFSDIKEGKAINNPSENQLVEEV